ncbi:glycoside hydrolase family 76 protein [Favolaschia claudopus]|uniref:Glycoside hydrolase family 76 protein n=1 Tax=Favolaschia claudopus TaxID=2862362 RepID=A0AAW0EFG7_9AGAR
MFRTSYLRPNSLSRLRLTPISRQRLRSTSSSYSKESRRSSDHSSDGRGSSWLSGFSDAGSDYSSQSSPPSASTPLDLTRYDHRLDLRFQGLDLTGQITKLEKYPFESGRSADIYRGMLTSTSAEQQTLRISIKIFRRMHHESDALEQTMKSIYSEALIWRRLVHINVLPFLGIALDLGPSPALISPFCASGPIMKYLKQRPNGPSERLQMTIDVGAGLEYLHSEGIIHGNLCTKKILVTEDGVPVVCGYGMSKTLGSTSQSTSLFSTSARFTPPECFLGDSGCLRTESTDAYAFSMVSLEILSGLEPYHHLPTEHTVVAQILRGKFPTRTHLDPHVVNDSIWRLLTSIWKDKPHSRPKISDLVRRLREMGPEVNEVCLHRFFFSSSEADEKSSSGEETFFEHHALQSIPGRDLKGLITQDDQYPFAGGGNANIYRGKLKRSDGRKIRVAIKMFRVSDDGSGQLEDIVRKLKREVEVWSKLRHKNILPFIGVCNDLAPSPVLISPFYKFGHVGSYLTKHPQINRGDIVRGVTSGLQYLHNNEIIHGDLKVQNVLVDKRGNPCICDFGISKIMNRAGFTTASVGTAPYMAPELFLVVDNYATDTDHPTTTKASDVYSFGLLVLEILTSEPLKGRPSKPIITVKLLENLHPKRADYDTEILTDKVWGVLEQCWAFEPRSRPKISLVSRRLSE